MALEASLGSTLLFGASFGLSLLVLLYRSSPPVRRSLDRILGRLTGRPDWSWLRLEHLMLPLAVLAAANVVWQLSSLPCSDDSYALLHSGAAALQGGDPFRVTVCSGSRAVPIPYGTAQVAIDAAAAAGGSVAGVWVVWELFGLAVVPLVWKLAGDDRRYVSVLAATSVLYLPNIATNIGVENAVVPVSVLLFLWTLRQPSRTARVLGGVAAFLSTARFPAVFALLGAASARRRVLDLLLVVGVFLAAVASSLAFWGPDAIQIVYLGEFQRASTESLNAFAPLLVGVHWSATLLSAAVQGAVLLVLVAFVQIRGYSPGAAAATPLLGVMALSQYLTFHFVLWIIPVLLVGPRLRWWAFVYGVAMFLDESVAYGVWAVQQGLWWPYEATGVALTVLLLYGLVEIHRGEERARGASPAGPRAGGASNTAPPT